jgi:hypothetical protein
MPLPPTAPAPIKSMSIAPKEEKKESLGLGDGKSDGEMDEAKDHWIVPGLYVKILNKNIADGQFYGKKGTSSSSSFFYCSFFFCTFPVFDFWFSRHYDPFSFSLSPCSRDSESH